MRSPVRFRSWAAALGLSLCPALAWAEDAPRAYPACDHTPTQGDVSAAKGAFDAGNGSFNEADYDRAITYWEDAYRRDCTAHPLLLNLARAYELNGLKQHAVTALQTFLARNPGSSEESQIKRRIEKLQEQIQSEAAAAPATPPGPAATPEPTPAATTTAPPPAAPPPEAASDSGGGLPIAPLVVAGAGVAMTVISGVIWLGANSDIKKFEQQCPGRTCPAGEQAVESQGNAAISKRDISGAFALVGIAAVLGGGIWFGVSMANQSSSSKGVTAFAPAVAPGYGGLSMIGRF